MKISRPSSLAVLATAFAVTLPALSPAYADAPTKPAVAVQPEDQPTISGSYLAARFASSERDNDAAVTYLRNLLKLDSRNPEVVERTFFATLMDGDMEAAVGLAQQLVKVDNSNRIARLTLGVNALIKKQFRTARSNLALSMRGPIGDLTAVLLSGWAYYGAGDTMNAVASVKNLQGPDASSSRRWNWTPAPCALWMPMPAGYHAMKAPRQPLRFMTSWMSAWRNIRLWKRRRSCWKPARPCPRW